MLIDDAQSAGAALARLVGVIDQPEPALDRPVSDDVEVRDLSHAYDPGRPVLHDVDLTIKAGERVALVGASGAGKTTLARLIAGIHRPLTGTIAVPGEVGMVTQDVHVFAGPLADDLRLARPDATDADLREALTRVDALTWADTLPEGLDTVVGEGGHRLTATQIQQLALARLILADPPGRRARRGDRRGGQRGRAGPGEGHRDHHRGPHGPHRRPPPHPGGGDRPRRRHGRRTHRGERPARRAALLRRPVRLLWEAWSGVRPTSENHLE